MPVKILIVEDNRDMRETMSLVLESEGYSVLAAEHGVQALQLLGRADPLPDLILLDLQMPVMDGETFMRALTCSGIPGAGDIPVVVVTASKQQPERARTVLRKPFDLQHLLAVVDAQAR